MTLNGLIGLGVPQDWATHMLGHELTAAFAMNHAQTLAVVLPRMLQATKADKHEKLIQYAERVWGVTTGCEDERIDLVIEKTEAFFQQLGVKTRLADYGEREDQFQRVIDKLKQHGMVEIKCPPHSGGVEEAPSKGANTLSVKFTGTIEFLSIYLVY